MHNKLRIFMAVLATLVLSMLPSIEVLAHGVNIEYTTKFEITILAKYDIGDPMAGAQVIVYAPDNPSTPWLTGICDDNGYFSFTADSSKPGIWDVTVRQAGHGNIVHIPVGKETDTSGSVGGYSYLQIALMSLCVIWGSLGTALYFWRKRRQT